MICGLQHGRAATREYMLALLKNVRGVRALYKEDILFMIHWTGTLTSEASLAKRQPLMRL
jgi:hypothetical protein